MRWAAAAAALVALGVVPSAAAAAATTYRDGSVYARVDATTITLGNSLAERRWDRASFRTASLVDKRGSDRVWSAGSRDFALKLASSGAEIGSDSFRATGVDVQRLARGGL